ncbi:hypothetical protein EET67_16010 [Pseudaminobacter arsenicus]|uniref:Uncharacterized protein n=1 Tax=Borborobacter arsenicus TaxID=1851146 RepID=A0A432V3I7_9HYPH|nr:hypothetical protein [Pseudaminobacter arsenicus]RUM96741.1 hypothetical protein EET67_16010 [Pseudaminobacter arsenicus]
MLDIDLPPLSLQEKITINLTLFFLSPNHSRIYRYKALDADHGKPSEITVDSAAPGRDNPHEYMRYAGQSSIGV